VVAGGRPSGVRPRASARSRGSARAVAHSRFGHVAAASARYGAADEGPELSSQSELRLARIAAMGALVAALSVAGCGRKSGLDPPPGATAADISVSRPDLSPPDPSTGRSGGEPVMLPDGRVIAPSEGPKRSTPIDWLLN
jgi:predicted small lipoprotein YifL